MANVRSAKPRARRAAFGFVSLGAAALLAAQIVGCAAPGEPSVRRGPIPMAVGDLAAKQQGNDVVLTFTVPAENVDHHPLKKTPTVEILREVAPPSATANAVIAVKAPSNLTLLATIPPATVEQLMQNRKIQFIEPLSAADFASQTSLNAVYVVRTFESEKKPSADSNPVALTLHPAYPAIADAKAENAPDGIAITWTPPQQTLTGTIPPVASYRIYRATAQSAAILTENSKGKSPLQRVGDVAAPPFLDSQVELGAHYVYSVRTVATYDTQQLESSDSNLMEVTARDTFPPSAPQGLIVTLVPAQQASGNNAASPAYLDLSWEIAPEHDVAGYNVYRSESASGPGKRQNADLLPTPAFRDMNTAPGRVYYYTVTAVDRAGNESAPSAPVTGSVTEDAPAATNP
jgi:hypothetical protein